MKTDKPLIVRHGEDHCVFSYTPYSVAEEFEQALAETESHSLWTALAKHLARRATSKDRQLLVDLAQHPERHTDLDQEMRWGLQYIVRGDVMLENGEVIKLDDMCDELGLPHLPYLEDLPDELEI